jgi:LmbE family N-acetylglucosaminyl deacetylase
VTSFDGQARGTSEQDWAACEWLRNAPELEPPSGTGLVVLAAHPDAGLDIYVIFASDGAASHPNSSTHRPTRLASLRKDEAVEAVRVLAPDATVEFLELPDGELTANGAAIRGALHAACWDETLLLAPWAYDRHPDHEACAHAARAIAAQQSGTELLEYPIWAWHWGVPGEELADLDPGATEIRRLTLRADLRAQKQAAIACYPTQTRSLSDAPGDEAVLTPASLAYFARDCECFFTIDPDRR